MNMLRLANDKSHDPASPTLSVGSDFSSVEDLTEPRSVQLMLKGAAGFMHALNKRKHSKERKEALPKPKAKQPGANRARPERRSSIPSWQNPNTMQQAGMGSMGSWQNPNASQLAGKQQGT